MKGLFESHEAWNAEFDAVVVLGQELGRAIKRYNELDDAASSPRAENTEAMHHYDMECCLRDAISVTEATSLPGAAIQIAVALIELNFLADQLPDEAQTYQTGKQVRAITRLLHSAMVTVDAFAGEGEKLADNVEPRFPALGEVPWPQNPPAGEPAEGGVS